MCAREAELTLTSDYAGSVLALGPLSPVPSPEGYDLCQEHAQRLSVPTGWQLLRHRTDPGPDAAQSAS